ncbi:hypothetical protein [Cohnella nanjingensis]|nr:hypothetical protein [Cohnella nanjingensis]
MSMPDVPNLTPVFRLTTEGAQHLLLVSVAMKELAMPSISRADR